jgi:hypothetical protein
MFGKISGWLDANKKQLEGASMFNPVVLALDGAGSMNNWLGATAFPERVESKDMLAPLGLGAMFAPFSPSNAVGTLGAGSMFANSESEAVPAGGPFGMP